MIEGVYTALITPFNEKGEIDEAGFIQNLEHQAEAGVSGVIVLGTTGESPTLSSEERKRLIEIAVSTLKGKVKVWVGTGSASTPDAIQKTKDAKALGADGALVVTPFYNKPTQEGLFAHFKAIAETAKFPLMLYNIQGRTGVNLKTETLKRLLAFEEIVAVKESSGNIAQVMEVIHETPPNFSTLSGDDALTLPILALGGRGVVSVLSNLLPRDVVEMTHAALNKDFQRAKTLHYRLLPLMNIAFIESNPVPIKAMMELMGQKAGSVRLPLVPMTQDNQKKVETCLKETLQLQP
ncbi:MAG: 4-hydroxy-tetrahydrodipicolinate synthase [Chlamydiia bacterium]|nr:4-hydroxy-tetrahydrodipicolinate synthase [Chlamydiia bacterium]